jgi:hypothetical protein
MKEQILQEINDLEQFFSADLWTKFHPEQIINGETWEREDSFIDEIDFQEYIEEHFRLLKDKLKELQE